MSIDLLKLILILMGSLILGVGAVIIARNFAQRLMLTGLLIGLAFYSGIGGSNAEVSSVYIVYYFAFFMAVIVGFHFGCVVFLPLSKNIGRKLPETLGSMSNGFAWNVVIALYVILSLFPLVWPELRIHHLLMPPILDLRAAFLRRFTDTPDAVLQLISYIRLLMTPFFYLALYRWRFRLRKAFAIIVCLMYIEFVANAYISRGTIAMNIALLTLGIWILKPIYRRRIIMCGAIIAPVLFYFFYWHASVRIGGTIGELGFGEKIISLFSSELSFVRLVGMPIIESGVRVNFADYLVWIITLPLPKLLTGPIEGARVNFEISEFILGLPIGSPGWYVVLPGIVSESFYILGSHLFWLHGIFIGIMAAFYARIAERVPQFLFLYLYIVIQFSYVLNRAGIAALLPTMINEFLLFYLYMLIMVFYRVRKVSPVNTVEVVLSTSKILNTEVGSPLLK